MKSTDKAKHHVEQLKIMSIVMDGIKENEVETEILNNVV